MAKKRRRAATALDIFGRFVRGLVLTAGFCAFGLSAGALAACGLVSAMMSPSPDDWGGAPALLLLMPIGGGIGLQVGLIAAICWIRNGEHPAYRAFDWLGLLLGIAAGIGLTLLVPDRYYFFMKCLFAPRSFRRVQRSGGRCLQSRLARGSSSDQNRSAAVIDSNERAV